MGIDDFKSQGAVPVFVVHLCLKILLNSVVDPDP
jgi:hypothetical protein